MNLKFILCALTAQILVVVLNILTIEAQAQSKSYNVERAQQRFFDLWPSVKSVALAGADRATSISSDSIFSNPAGLAGLNHSEFSSAYTYNQTGAKSGISEYQHVGSASIAAALDDDDKQQVIAFGWQAMQGGPDDFPINSENRMQAFEFGYGFELDALQLGYVLALHNNEVYSNAYDLEMDSGLSQTVGLRYEFSDQVIGVSAHFGSADSQYQSSIAERDTSSQLTEYGFSIGYLRSMLPYNLYIGLANNEYIAEGDNSFASDSQFGGDESGTFMSPSLGVEVVFNDKISGLIGGRYIYRRHFFASENISDLSGNANSFAWSAGLKANFKYFDLELAFEQRELERGNRQLISGITVPL